VTVGVRCACAETLAYWYLNGLSEGVDLRNAVGTNHVFEMRQGDVSPSFRKPLAVVPEWGGLPAATRGSRHNNGSALFEAGGHAFLCAPGLGRRLGLTCSFTVEGWLRKACDPVPGACCRLFGAEQASGAGWGVSLRTEGGKTRFHVRADCPQDRLVFDQCFQASEVSGDYDWMHVAMVYDAARAATGVWELFVNGTARGMVTNTVKPVLSQRFDDFTLGGSAGGDTFAGQANLWRVSDEALPAARFLNASAVRTLAYWPLDTAVGGGLDLTDKAGGGYTLCPGKDGGVSGSAEQAVARVQNRQPPFWRGIRDVQANSGSVRLAGELGRRSLLAAPDLGLRCDLTNSFTVEGWFRKEGNPGERYWCLAGARDDSNGWTLSLRQDGNGVRFHLHVSDVNQGGRLQFERFFHNAEVSGNAGWCHVALVYDHLRGGCGVWELFLDGVSQGEIRNPAPPDRSHGWRDFSLGGRASFSNSYVGGMDCWRVSDGPLAPEQFLCNVPDAGRRSARVPGDDPRRIACGLLIPAGTACGQPSLGVLRDGTWVCVLTAGSGSGKAVGQRVVSTASRDKGKTWSPLVEIASAKGAGEGSATCLVTPFDRIYAFYTDEGDKVAAISGQTNRVESAARGGCVFKYSDDGGLTWARERNRIPLWAAGTVARSFGGVSKPVVADGGVCFAFTTQAEGGVEGEGWVAVSDNILTERNAGRVRFTVLPESGNGIRNPAFGPVQGGHHLVALGSNTLFCAYRTEGLPAQSVSRDGGRVWTLPESMTYGVGQRVIKADCAGVNVFRTRAGRYLACYRNSVVPQQSGHMPVLLMGGQLDGNGVLQWSEPEMLVYDPKHSGEILCGDMLEQDGRFWFSVTQAGVVRMVEASRSLLEGVWRQKGWREVSRAGLAAEFANPAGVDQSFGVPATFGKLTGGGVSVELWVLPNHALFGETLFSTQEGRRGIRAGTLSVKGEWTVRVELYDGDRQVMWQADHGVLQNDRLHHVVFICDAVAGFVVAVVDGVYCDGGEKRASGLGSIPAGLGTVDVTGRARISGRVRHVRLYDRALRISEAVGNFRAGVTP